MPKHPTDCVLNTGSEHDMSTESDSSARSCAKSVCIRSVIHTSFAFATSVAIFNKTLPAEPKQTPYPAVAVAFILFSPASAHQLLYFDQEQLLGPASTHRRGCQALPQLFFLFARGSRGGVLARGRPPQAELPPVHLNNDSKAVGRRC